MAPRPTPTASPHLFQRVACWELGGVEEGADRFFQKAEVWRQNQPGRPPRPRRLSGQVGGEENFLPWGRNIPLPYP